jgi:hypothetical protein
VGVLLLLGVRFDATYAATAAASLLAAGAILAGALLVTKSQARAERLGRGVGRVAPPQSAARSTPTGGPPRSPTSRMSCLAGRADNLIEPASALRALALTLDVHQRLRQSAR